MSNDNGSFYKGYLGYPAIGYLLLIGELDYSPIVAKKLKGLAWKDINQQFKNTLIKPWSIFCTTGLRRINES